MRQQFCAACGHDVHRTFCGDIEDACHWMEIVLRREELTYLAYLHGGYGFSKKVLKFAF